MTSSAPSSPRDKMLAHKYAARKIPSCVEANTVLLNRVTLKDIQKFGNDEKVQMTRTPLQRVEVQGYCYLTDLPVKLGDKVHLPASDFTPEWEGTITKLGSDYTGPCRKIKAIISEATPATKID